jgi:excisionase family DNA binding protein
LRELLSIVPFTLTLRAICGLDQKIGQWTGLVHLSAPARAVHTPAAQPVVTQYVSPQRLEPHQSGTAPAIAQRTQRRKAFMDSAATTLEPRLGRSVSIDQAAALLNVSRRTIYNRIREGRLLTIRTIGGSQRVLVESLVELGFRPQAFSAAAAQMAFVARPLSR